MKFLIATALLIAAPAVAQNSTTPAEGKADAAKSAKNDPDRKTCRRDSMTSTRLAKQTCRTNAEWREIDQRTDGANNMVRSH